MGRFCWWWNGDEGWLYGRQACVELTCLKHFSRKHVQRGCCVGGYNKDDVERYAIDEKRMMEM